MRTRRAEASSPNSDPQLFWNEYLQKWTDLRVNCIAEAQLPLCQEKPSMESFKKDHIRKLNIDLRADLLKTWTEQEKELFTQRFIEVGKDFPLIADTLPGKTVAQCIQYYYLTKHRFCYKTLRKKAIDETNGARIRRAKSCGTGKGTKRPSQRFGDTGKVNKENLRKTYSCPEHNILESKEMFSDNRSRTNEGSASLEHMEPISVNATGGLSDHKKSLSTKTSEDVNEDIFGTRKRKLTEDETLIKGPSKLSTASGQCSDISEYMNNQGGVKISKAPGIKTPCFTVAGKRAKHDSTKNGVLPITEVKKMDSALPGSSQDQMGSATNKALLKNKRKDVCKSTTEVTGKIKLTSCEKGPNGTSCTYTKGTINRNSACGKVKKRSRIDDKGGKYFKKLKTKPSDKWARLSKAAKESSTGVVQIKRQMKRKNTLKNAIADNCCSAPKRKRIVEEVSDHKHRHSSDRVKVRKLQQKSKRDDARIKSSKKIRQSDICGHSSGCGNEDYEEGKNRKRNSKGLLRDLSPKSKKHCKNNSKEAGQTCRQQCVKSVKDSCDVGNCSATFHDDGILITVKYDGRPCYNDDCRITCVKGKIAHYDERGRQKVVTDNEDLCKPSTSKRRNYSDNYTEGTVCDTDCTCDIT